jgi:hypothetical protein
MHRSSRWFVTVAAFCLASVINPGYFAGCASSTGDDDPGPEPGSEKFEFGEAEMLALVDEANATSPFDFTQGPDHYRVEMFFEQRAGEDQDDTASLQRPAPFKMRAFACGTRTFMQSAAACVTMSQVLLTATINLYRLDGEDTTPIVQNRKVDAYLSVGGYKLTNANIISGSYGVGDNSTQIALGSADGKTFKLDQFRIVDSELLVQADKK